MVHAVCGFYNKVFPTQVLKDSLYIFKKACHFAFHIYVFNSGFIFKYFEIGIRFHCFPLDYQMFQHHILSDLSFAS